MHFVKPARTFAYLAKCEYFDVSDMKIETKAFKNPEITYDSSLIGTLDTFDDWTFEFPYVFTFIRFILNNITNVVIYAFRFIL